MNKLVMYTWLKYIGSTKKIPIFFWYRMFKLLIYVRSRKNDILDTTKEIPKIFWYNAFLIVLFVCICVYM